MDTEQQPYERKRWSDLLNTQQIVGDAIDTQQIVGDWIDTQQIGDAIVIHYSTNRRRYRYPILNKLEALLLSDTQQIVGDVIDTQQQSCRRKRSSDLPDTQQIVVDVIIIQYSTIRRRRDPYPILNKWPETRSIFNTAWQGANVLTMVKLIYNKNTRN